MHTEDFSEMIVTLTNDEYNFVCDLEVSYELVKEGGSNYNGEIVEGGTHEG